MAAIPNASHPNIRQPVQRLEAGDVHALRPYFWDGRILVPTPGRSVHQILHNSPAVRAAALASMALLNASHSSCVQRCLGCRWLIFLTGFERSMDPPSNVAQFRFRASANSARASQVCLHRGGGRGPRHLRIPVSCQCRIWPRQRLQKHWIGWNTNQVSEAWFLLGSGRGGAVALVSTMSCCDAPASPVDTVACPTAAPSCTTFLP